VAIDTQDPGQAAATGRALAGSVGLIKLGLEFFVANGPQAVREVATAAARPVFLDLKLHDIPNTVAGAVRAACQVGPAMLTLHAAGGPRMLAAARDAADTTGSARPLLLAVTVLTSLDAAQLEAIGAGRDVAAQVLRLARLAAECGMDGVVCSPNEARLIRDALGDQLVLVVPGIRPAGSAVGDQARVATPAQAVEAGADWLVVGRPITEAPDPQAAARAIAATL
jgi:orotidine-5'-phosphate decarboxylase